MPPPAVAVPAAATPRFAVSARAGSFSLEIAYEGRASRLALLGPSGAGKTLTLRSLLGTHRAAHVQLALAGHELSRLASERRGIGYVPQQPALLPRRTVTEQVLLGRGAGLQEAREWIEAVGLAGLEDRYPGQLSGGQQRRVALARALAARPRLLLLDEPFSGLDTPTRRVLIERLRELQDEAACSTVLVTHEPLEAALLAEEIIVIDGGSVLQAGITAEVFRAPAGPRSAELLGIRNARRGTVLARGLLRSHGLEIRADTGSLSPGAPVLWTIDPAAVGLEAAGAALAPGAADAHEARLLRDDDLGIARELSLALGDGLRLAAHLGPGEAAPALAGEALSVALDPARIAVHRDLEQRA